MPFTKGDRVTVATPVGNDVQFRGRTGTLWGYTKQHGYANVMLDGGIAVLLHPESLIRAPDVPDAVMSAMETETDPLPDAVASAWDTELNPPPKHSRPRPSYNLTQERYEQAWREKQRLR